MQYAVLATKLVYGLISYCTHTKRPSNIFCNVDHCQVSCIKLRHCLHCHWRVFNINCRMAGYHIHVWLDGISSTSCTKCCLRCHWLYIYTPSPRVYNAPVKVSPRLPQAGDYRGLGLRNWRKSVADLAPPGPFEKKMPRSCFWKLLKHTEAIGKNSELFQEELFQNSVFYLFK
jgi:hypothetical protein